MVAINEFFNAACGAENRRARGGICVENANREVKKLRSLSEHCVETRGWITRDPIGVSGGINLYGYVESGPVGKVDASGQDAWGFGIPSGTPIAVPPGYYISGWGQYGETVKPLPASTPHPASGLARAKRRHGDDENQFWCALDMILLVPELIVPGMTCFRLIGSVKARSVSRREFVMLMPLGTGRTEFGQSHNVFVVKQRAWIRADQFGAGRV